jgi:hypothetical protein
MKEVSRAYAFWRVLRTMARSIQSIRLLASAQGNQMEVLAFMQEVAQTYSFWQVLWGPEHIIALQAFVLGNWISKGLFCLEKYQSIQLLTQQYKLIAATGCLQEIPAKYFYSKELIVYLTALLSFVPYSKTGDPSINCLLD